MASAEDQEARQLEHPPMSLCWNNVSYSVQHRTSFAGSKTTKHILHDLYGVVHPGEMIAIMGPSGCGKSTTLNVLANRIKGYSGDVLFNGLPYTSAMRRHASYVMQDDALLGSLTVKENIEYSADFLIPGSVSRAEKARRVKSVITDLGLTRVQDSKVGNVLIRGVSGGERRRTSIATELVAEPSILFLDEPTSGLDATSALNVMSNIKDIAVRQQRAVVAVIHQPSSSVLALFDKVMFLTHGRVAYFGPVNDIPEFLESVGEPVPAFVNLADHMMDLINDDFGENAKTTANTMRNSSSLEDAVTVASDSGSGSGSGSGSEQRESSSEGGDVEPVDRVTKIVTAFAESEWAARVKADVDAVIAEPGEVEFPQDGCHCCQSEGEFARALPVQTLILTRRAMLNAVRYLALYWVRVAMYVMLALLMGTVWYKEGPHNQRQIQDRFGVHFFSVAFLCFMSVAAIPAYIEDRVIFERERSNGKYSTLAYLTANTLISSVFVFVIAIVFSAIIYWMIGMNDDPHERFWRFVLFLYLALLVAESIMVCLSAMIPYFIIALALGAGANGFFMVVQGYFIRASMIPRGWKWAHYVSYQKYSFEALVANDFRGRTFDCAPATTTGGSCFCLFRPAIAGACSFTGEDVLREYGYEDVDLWDWFGVLMGMIAFYRIMTYALMRLKKMSV